MGYAEDIAGGSTTAGSYNPPDYTTPAPGGFQSQSQGSPDYGMTPMDLWAVQQAQWAASMGQQAALQREAMALQKAIAAMQQAYNFASLNTSSEAEARQYAFTVGQAELQRQLSTGWVQAGPFNPASMAQDPYLAIWENNPDIRNQYAKAWKSRSITPQAAVADWLKKQRISDAAAYAQEKGWYQPYSQQTLTPTLEREAFWASLRGPRDYYVYQNILRGEQTGQWPSWTTAAQTGQALPGFQAPSGTLPGYWNEPGMVQAPNIAPHHLSATTWASMTPSEREMALGAAEAQGWNAEDYLAMMQKAFPGNPGAKTTWWQA